MSSTSLRTTKRPRLSAESQPPGWSCPACTYLNPLSAFKCQICDTRKGTSTRISSAVDPGAIEIQRTIQEQIQQRSKRHSHPHSRRADSAAGSSDTHSIGHPTRRNGNRVKREDGSLLDEDNSANESWRSDDTEMEDDADQASNSSAASSLSDIARRTSKCVSAKSNKQRSRRRLSPTPSPSPPPQTPKATSSKASTSVGKKSNKNGLKSGNGIAKSEPDDANIPHSSASSCCNSVISSLPVANGKQKSSNEKMLSGKNVKKNGKYIRSKRRSSLPVNAAVLSNRRHCGETSVTVRGITVVFTEFEPV